MRLSAILLMIIPLLTSCIHDNTYVIKDSINPESAEKFIEFIDNTNKDVILIFDSPGGYDSSMEKMIAALERNKEKIQFCVVKYAASAAFNIFQRCEKRYVLKQARLMFHAGGYIIEGYISLFDMYRYGLAGMEKFLKEVAYLSKRSGTSAAVILKYSNDRDWDMNAEEALKYGMADRIIEWDV